MTLKFIDICCGIGGFHQALNKMGYSCVMASDIDKQCREDYEKNYNLRPLGDIHEVSVVDIPNFDILCAGFPCQPFSKAGKMKGFSDTRGNVFFKIGEIARYHKPKYMILENVRNLKNHDKGNTWKIIHQHIHELGYVTYEKPIIMNALYFGVPQFRERVIILCKRKDLGPLPNLPTLTHKLCVQETDLKTIIVNDTEYNKSFQLPNKLKVTEKVWNNFLHILNENSITVPKFPIWTDWWDSDGEGTTVTKKDKNKSEKENVEYIIEKQVQFYKKYEKWINQNRHFYHANEKLLKPWLEESRHEPLWKGAVRKFEWQVKTLEPKMTMNDVLWSARGSGVRCKNTNYSPTLVAMTSMIPVYGPESRFLTPKECSKLQSFPDNFIINPNPKIAYKQFGNAVNVDMIERCARFLMTNEPLFDK